MILLEIHSKYCFVSALNWPNLANNSVDFKRSDVFKSLSNDLQETASFSDKHLKPIIHYGVARVEKVGGFR